MSNLVPQRNSLTPEEKLKRYNVYVELSKSIRSIDEEKQFLCLNKITSESDDKLITEIAWSIFKKNGTITKKKYAIVKENLGQGRYKNENEKPSNSEILELDAIQQAINKDIEKVDYIVGQCIDKLLNSFSLLNTSKFVKMTDTTVPEYGMIDIDDLCNCGSLDKYLKSLKYPYEKSDTADEDVVNMVSFFTKVIYNDFVKIITAIRNNIGDNKNFLSLDIETESNNPNSISEVAWCIFQKDGTISKKKYYIVKENCEANTSDNLIIKPEINTDNNLIIKPEISTDNNLIIKPEINTDNNLIIKPENKDLNGISEALKNDLEDVHYIVSQRSDIDQNLLKILNFDSTKFVIMKNNQVPKYGMIDVTILYSGIYLTSHNLTLEQGLKNLNIPYDNLNNAGNNVHYIMQLFRKIIDNDKPEIYKECVNLIHVIRNRIDNNKLFLCVDIEAYEMDHKYLTEFGWCIFKKDGTIIKNKHAIVKENMQYHNGVHVPDNRDYFLFGQSTIMELKAIEEELRQDVEKVNYIVGHGVINDIRYLRKIKVKTGKFIKMKSSSCPRYGLIDTMDLYSGVYLSKAVSLEKSLKKLEIPYDRLHNGGNDVNYTMKIFFKIINELKTPSLKSPSTSSSIENKIKFAKFRNLAKIINAIQHNISKSKLYLAISIEPYELDSKKIIEMGWCIFKKDGTIRKRKHVIVKENSELKNGNKLPDNRDNYLFGKTETQDMKDIIEDLRKDIDKVSYLVSHGVDNMISYFHALNINIIKFSKMKNNRVPSCGIIDTMDLYAGKYSIQSESLEKCLKKLKIEYDKLHNAGNDAIYTMEVLLKIVHTKYISLQISEKDKLKDITDYMANLSKKSNINTKQKSKVKEKKNETITYKEYAKLIEGIRNIDNNKLYLCLDIEAFEFDQKKLTEFGWCIFKKDGTIIKKKHTIVEEYVNLRNGKHVPDNKDNFLFGQSDTQKLEIVEEELKYDIENVNYLVGQGIKSDIRYLKSIDVNTSKFTTMKNQKIPEFGVIDTMDLFSGNFNTKGVSLEKSLIKLKIPYDKLHNAGNDALFTMQVFMKIINNSETVPLQLSNEFLKTEEELEKNANSKKSKSKNKSDAEKYKDYNKLINAVRNNINKNKQYLCLDIEAYEGDQKILTEFGWCIFKKDGNIVKNKHVIVKENMKYHNGTKVPDNRDYYLFGDSEIQELKVIENELKKDIDSVNYIVGQGVNNDLHYLQSIQVNTSKFVCMKDFKVEKYGVIDTMDLYSGLFKAPAVGLEKMLIKFKIPYDRLHNAGNDTVFTMQVFMKIINNSKEVPLQLSKEIVKEINNESIKTKNDQTSKPKNKKGKNEAEKYSDFAKLINTIKNNINRNKLYLSLDIEAYEQNQSILTEIGWCIFKKDGSILKKKHAIVKENTKYHNGGNVPDHRENYLFGDSEEQELKVIIAELKKDIDKVNYIVSQAVSNDIRYLKSIDIDTSKFVCMKNYKVQKYGIIDTIDIYSGKFNSQRISLQKMLIKLQIPYVKLHNAGNDAIFIMQIFLKIVNDIKVVPLQLPRNLINDVPEEIKIVPDEPNVKNNSQQKSKKKDDMKRYGEFEKLINTIKYNIGKDKLFLCFDIEAYENDHSILTEFGWCIFKKDCSIIKKKHAIVKENMDYHNGTKVPDNRDNFLFGESEIKELKVIEEELRKDIESVNYLVGQGIGNDLRYLKSIQVDTSKFITMRNSRVQKFGVIDTMDLYSGMFNIPSVSLQKMLIKLKIPYDKLHNGGNDTIFTTQVFLKIITNCKKVPLQLSKKLLKENNEESRKLSEKSTDSKTNSSASKLKNKKKDEMERYEDLAKLINTIKFNIGSSRSYLCLDIEAYEGDQKILTEFGWCVFKKDGTLLKTKHAIVKEHMNYRNGHNVPDNRDYYLFGKSEIQELKVIEEELKKDIESVNYLVGQGIDNDIRYLKSIDVNTSKFIKMKDSKVQKFGIIDTMDLYSGLYSTQGVSLERSLIKLKIPYDRLHNGGNDSIFTMQVFLKIVTNCKKVPLQLPKILIKEGEDATENNSNELSLKNEEDSSSSPKLKTNGKYDDYAKLISTIKFNVGKSKSFLSIAMNGEIKDENVIISEIGWCIFKKDGLISVKRHAIVKEHQVTTVTTDENSRDVFLFGESEVQELNVIEEELKKDIENVNYIIGQDIDEIQNYLKSIHINTTKFVIMKNPKVHKYGMIDTMDLISGHFNIDSIGLEESLNKLQIPYDKLNNSGNDAVYLMQIFFKIVSDFKKVPLQLRKSKMKEDINEEYAN